MFGFWKRNKRKQDCLLLTEDGRILELSLSVPMKGYVLEEKTQEAWELFPNSLVPQRGTGKVCLLINEREAAPMSLNGNNSPSKLTKETIKQIAIEHADEALAQLQTRSRNSKMADTLRLVIIIFAITISVLVIFGAIATGKLSLPDLGGLFGGF